MTNYSDDVLELYECLAAVPVTRFRSWAHELLQKHLPCDRAQWSHCTALEASEVSVPSQTGELDRSSLRLALPHSARGMVNLFQLQRDAPLKPFSLDERTRLGIFARHILAAWQLRLQLALQDICMRQAQSVAVLVGGDGIVERATAEFHAVARSAFKGWSAVRLPDALQQLSGEEPITLGHHRWNARRLGELRVVWATALGAHASLSPREETIASAILNGASHLEAAQQLQISPNTVRNTVARVYRKLNVRNRMEFARSMRAHWVR